MTTYESAAWLVHSPWAVENQFIHTYTCVYILKITQSIYESSLTGVLLSILGLLVVTCVGLFTGKGFLWSGCAIICTTGCFWSSCAIGCDTDCFDCAVLPWGI